jgi:hypothetical protein
VTGSVSHATCHPASVAVEQEAAHHRGAGSSFHNAYTYGPGFPIALHPQADPRYGLAVSIEASLGVLPAGIAAWGHVAPTPLARGVSEEALPIVLPAPCALGVLIAVGRLDLAPIVLSNQATPVFCHEAIVLSMLAARAMLVSVCSSPFLTSVRSLTDVDAESGAS